MKTALIFGLLLPVFGFGQTETPLKKCDVILVQTDLMPGELHTILLKWLAREGYVVEKSDREVLTAETKFRESGAFQMRYLFFVDEMGGKGLLRIRGNNIWGIFFSLRCRIGCRIFAPCLPCRHIPAVPNGRQSAQHKSAG